MKNKLIVFALFCITSITTTAQNSDLIITQIFDPEYDSDSSYVIVIVKNNGTEHFPCDYKIRVSEADVSLKEAKKRAKKFKAHIETRGNFKIYYPNKQANLETAHVYESKSFFGLEGEKSAIIKVYIGDWWPYNPNCGLKVEIVPDCFGIDASNEDYSNASGDNKDNNFGYFFAGG